ncbi:MAG: tubulin-like doman-containing protein [Chloroflexota bacterium]|nr:tubulin-like doman-containing protein [Chloroflexota bacterium]
MHQGSRNRAAIVGVGGWGARVVAHMWPRLRTRDRSRVLAPSLFAGTAGRGRGVASRFMGLPLLSDIVSYVLVLPDEDGSITVARPGPDRWDDVSFYRQQFLARESLEDPARALSDSHPSVLEMQRDTHRLLWPTLDIVGHYAAPDDTGSSMSRRLWYQHFCRSQPAIAADLLAIIEQARYDETEPEEEESQLSVFVVASLADEHATALLWPLTDLLRNQVGGILEQIGLLSSAVFTPPPERRREEASVHLAARELVHLTTPGARGGNDFMDSLQTVASEFSPFDRSYLFDRVKTSGALVKDEGELTTVVGNVLEAFLTADANIYLRNALAPDTAALRELGPFSSIGAAAVYIPLDEMWTQARQRLMLELLRDRFLLALSEIQQAEAERIAGSLADIFLDLDRLAERFLASDSMARAGGSSQAMHGGEAVDIPQVRAVVPPAPAETPEKDADLVSRVADVSEQFDRFEQEGLSEWQKTGAVLADSLSQAADAGDADSRPTTLKQLDDEILSLILDHDQGLQAALSMVIAFHSQLERRRAAIHEWQRLHRPEPEPVEKDAQWSRWAQLEHLVKQPWLWLAITAGVGLLTMLIVAVVLNQRGVDTGALAAASVGAGIVVLLLSLALRRVLKKTVQGRVDAYRSMRQRRVDALANASLASDLDKLLAGLQRAVAQREQALSATLSSLEEDRNVLATQLSEPLTVPHSFVRQPLAQEELYEEFRDRSAHLPDQDVAPVVFKGSPDTEEGISQAWLRTIPVKTTALDGDHAASPPEPNLAEAMSLAIERYAARLSRPEAPAEVNVEAVLSQAVPEFDRSEFLISLRQRAKPLVFLNDQGAAVPIRIDLMAVPNASISTIAELGMQASELRLRLLSSYDPFSLTLLRTLHGIPLEAIASFASYERSYLNLDPDQQEALALPDLLPIPTSSPQ